MHHHFEDDMNPRAERMWRKLEAVGRRGGWGPGRGGPGGRGGWGNWGDWGDWGENFRIGRMLASGDLRLVALYFIEQQPRHGYDLIKAIEEKTSGVYAPSPGVIYPALTYLEEAGYVSSTTEGNKRLYTITGEGRSHLEDNRSAVEGTLDHLGHIGERAKHLRDRWEEMQRTKQDWNRRDRDMQDVAPEVNDARRALKHAIRDAVRSGNAEALRRLPDILRRAAEDIRAATPPREDGPEIDL